MFSGLLFLYWLYYLNEYVLHEERQFNIIRTHVPKSRHRVLYYIVLYTIWTSDFKKLHNSYELIVRTKISVNSDHQGSVEAADLVVHCF